MNTIIEKGVAEQDNKLLTFRLYGNFAHFNQPISNRFRNTYSVIPKPQLLGLIGSLIGLEGYKNKDTIPEFHQKLSDIKVYIKPNTNHDRKFAITYNSMNSFLSNRVDGGPPNVIMNEQILMEPDYEIGLLLDGHDALHKRIIEHVQNNCTTFPIYFGKNEFFANIQYISLEDYELNLMDDVVCNSILPFDELGDESTSNVKIELLPIGFNEHFKYIYHLMAIPQKDCGICIKNPSKFITSNGNKYYVF